MLSDLWHAFCLGDSRGGLRQLLCSPRKIMSGSGDRGFTLIELLIVVTILGIVSALAIPNYLRYQGHTRQSEAKTNLAAIFVAESAYYGEQTRYGTFSEIGYALAGMANRYAYRVGAGTTAGVDLIIPQIGTDPGPNTVLPAGMTVLPNPGFTATATANLDADPAIDMWHVNDLKHGLKSADQSDIQ
jgi:type IV pilus assembly protein PilA